MEVGDIIRGCIIIVGLWLFGITISSLAKRKMTETFCVIWGGVSVLVILAGILLRPVVLNNYISTTGLVIIFLVGVCVIFGAYFISTMISDLTRKNQELAIQVSLLKRENEKIIQKLEKWEGKMADEEDINHD
ncbi:MAG: DUF2304 family protein [Lachnospiraceae bacterium]|nr:DUF2304 family protein [Lachnospiraceae bacterium]